MRALLLVSVLAWAYCGCGPAPMGTDRAIAYGAELNACVVTATTLAQSRACRCDVAKRYGRACDDAGVP